MIDDCSIWGMPAWLFGFAGGVLTVGLVAALAMVGLAVRYRFAIHHLQQRPADAAARGKVEITFLCERCNGLGVLNVPTDDQAIAQAEHLQCDECAGSGRVRFVLGDRGLQNP